MNVDMASWTVMDYLQGLKSDVRLKGFGKHFVWGFVSYVLFFALSLIHFFVPVVFGVQGIYMKNTAGALASIALLIVCISICVVWETRRRILKTGKACRETQCLFCLLFTGIWITSVVGVFLFVLLNHVNSFWFLFGASLLYALIGCSFFVYLVLGPANKSTAEAIRKQMRIQHTNMIKYAFLGVISGDDSDLSKMNEVVDYSKRNNTMVKKIRNSKEKKNNELEVFKRYESYSPTFMASINSKIIEVENKRKTIDMALIISTVVSFVIAAVDKIYDAGSNYISVRYKIEVTNLLVIDDIPAKDALNLTSWILSTSIAGAALILLFLLSAFFCYREAIVFLNQRNATTLSNLKYARNALRDLDYEIYDVKPLSDNEKSDD